MKWKKRGFSNLSTILILLLINIAQAESVYYEGEGSIELTEKSVASFSPSDIATRQNVRANLTVIVDPFALNFPNISAFTTVLDDNGNPVYALDETVCTLEEQSSNEAIPVTESITKITSIWSIKNRWGGTA